MPTPPDEAVKIERLKQIMTMTGRITPEFVSARPPSEAQSLLIRATRGCAWNHCSYCGLYRHVESSQRSVDEICLDVEMLALHIAQPVHTVFLGDGDAFELETDDLWTVLAYIYASFPTLQRVTSYATAMSVQRKSDDDLRRLHQAGLTRLHIGLESGDNQVLRDIIKGVRAADMIQAGQRTRAAGIELSFYVMLGLGGTDRWLEHARGTVEVLNQVEPEHIRLRTLAYDPQAPIFSLMDVRAGDYTLKLPQGRRREVQTPLGTLYELHELLTRLTVRSGAIMADHHSNFIEEFSGVLPHDQGRLLQQVEARIAEMVSGQGPRARLKLYT